MIFPTNIPSDPTWKRKQKRWTATAFAFFPCTQWCPAKNRTGVSHSLGWALMVLSDKTTLFLRRSMSSFFLSTVHQWIRSLFSKSPTLTWPMYKAQHSIGGTASADLIFARRGGPRHRHCGIFHHIAACATPSLPSHTATTGICTDHFFFDDRTS